MIPYKGSLFNFGILFRVHGSALYKALLPSFISTSFYLTLYYLYPDAEDLDLVEDRTLSHPYVVAALVAAFTFLLTFRANFGYNRYWEGILTKVISVFLLRLYAERRLFQTL